MGDKGSLHKSLVSITAALRNIKIETAVVQGHKSLNNFVTISSTTCQTF